jgi:hypothetical protein
MVGETIKLLKEWYWSPSRVWHWNNLRAILSNVRYRILFLFFDLLIIIFLFYFLSFNLNYFYARGELFGQIFWLGFISFLLILPAIYGYRSLNQIFSELDLNTSIHDIRREIEAYLRERGKDRNTHALEVKMNALRKSLKHFIDVSEILAPPIYNYELDRLHKGIDVFFNSTAEALFPTEHLFSRAQKMEQQQSLDLYRSQEHPTNEELEEQFEEGKKDEIGKIDWFDLRALDEFLQYLGNGLFARTSAYSAFSYKHPINLIMLSGFFDYWNSVVSSCGNCRTIFEKARKDIEEYYKSAGRREMLSRQRKWRLMDEAIIVIVSVALSTFLSYLLFVMKLLPQT